MTERIVSKFIDSNVFVVSHGDECVVIDAGASVEAIMSAVGGKKVIAIFLTHGHYDHCFNILNYIKSFGCKVYCSENAKKYLQKVEYNYSEGKFQVQDFSNFIFLKGQGKLELSSFEILYFQLGGHSFGDMAYKIENELFVGDLLIGRDIGRIDLYGGNKDDMAKSLQFFIDEHYEIMHSGHGQDNDKKTQDKVAKLWLKFLNR